MNHRHEQGNTAGFLPHCGLVVVGIHDLKRLMTFRVFVYFLILLPALVAGTYAWSRFFGRIGEGTYRRIIFVLLAFLGAFMIYGTL